MRKRNHVIPLHLNAKELKHLDTQVGASGLSREEFLRTLIMGAALPTVVVKVPLVLGTAVFNAIVVQALFFPLKKVLNK